jgi:hypothetical protein
MTSAVSVKITPNTVSASTKDKENCAVLSFSDNAIKSTQPLFVGEGRVIATDQYLSYNTTTGTLNCNHLQTQGYDVIASSDKLSFQQTVQEQLSVYEVEAENINVKDLKVNGNPVLEISPDISFEIATGTLIVKNLRVLNTIEVENQ